METIELGSWDEFRDHVKRIRDTYGIHKYDSGYTEKNTVLFRGHADSCWHLKTTLERCTDRSITYDHYKLSILESVNELESITGRMWDIPSDSALNEKTEANLKAYYGYLIYLRHHGFPSPLLDWTESPYIAAYFAFTEKQPSDRVAIYTFIEKPKTGKAKNLGPAWISVIGPYVTTDSRHFAQKAQYTFATQRDENGQKTFCNHELVFNQNAEHQDWLRKFTLPSRDRIKALQELNDYNINHFTLFQTEDALVRTLGQKRFELEHP